MVSLPTKPFEDLYVAAEATEWTQLLWDTFGCFVFSRKNQTSLTSDPYPQTYGIFRPKECCSWEECVCWRILHKSYCMSEQNQGTAKLGSAGRPIFWLSTSTLTTICMVLFHVASWVDFVFTCSLGGTGSIRGHDELAGEAVLAVLPSSFSVTQFGTSFWRNRLTWILRGSRWIQPIRSSVVLLCCVCSSAFIFCFMHKRATVPLFGPSARYFSWHVLPSEKSKLIWQFAQQSMENWRARCCCKQGLSWQKQGPSFWQHFFWWSKNQLSI